MGTWGRPKFAAFTAILVLFPAVAGAQGILQTVIGADRLFPRQPMPATEAPFGYTGRISSDSSGRVCVPDIVYHIVVVIQPGGDLSIVAGNGIPGFSGDGGPALSASLLKPMACLFDAQGRILIADTGNRRVRRVNADGTITTVAGTGEIGISGDGGPALEATLDSPMALAVNAAGAVYISDSPRNRIRAVSGDGIIRTVSTAIVYPDGMAFDRNGVLHVAEVGAHRIRRILANGTVETVAGTALNGFSGDGARALDATLNQPRAVAFDPAGNLLIADSMNNRLRSIDAAGIIRTVAGSGSDTLSGDGGPALQAGIFVPFAIALDGAGNLYCADSHNKVRRIAADRTIRTYAGSFYDGATGDGTDAQSAQMNFPGHLSFDRSGNLFVPHGNRISRWSPAGEYTTVAGNGINTFRGDGGRAIDASLSAPFAVAADYSGNLIISDTYNFRIRRVSASGIITTIAGTNRSQYSGDNGPAVQASLGLPLGLAVDPANNIYFADLFPYRIRRISPDGVITTVAGNGQNTATGDGGPATQASIGQPYGVAVDGAGNLYIADNLNHVVRRVTPQGIITTVAGNRVKGFSGDGGPATRASLNGPRGIAFLPSGAMLITDYDNHRIRMVDLAGNISTVAGTGEPGAAQDGTPALQSALNGPFGVAVASNGDIYFSDTLNHKIKAVTRAVPAVGVSANEVTLSLEAGGAAATRSLSVSSSIPGVAYSARIRLPDGTAAPWVEITPAEGRLPANLPLRFSAATLAAGEYAASLDIRVPGANPASLTIPILLTVEQPAVSTGTVSVAPETLSFNAEEYGQAQRELLLVFARGGSGPVSYRAEAVSDSSWLQVRAAAGISLPDQPDNLVVTADPDGLAPGQYNGRVLLRDTQDKETAIAVSLTVGRPAQIIRLSQTGLSFQAIEGSGDVAQKFAVLNTGTGVMPWSAQASTTSGGNWLRASSTVNSTDASSLSIPEVTVSVSAESLRPGQYRGTIDIVAAGASNSPQRVDVELTVLPAGSKPRPLLFDTGLVFGARPQAGSPSAQEVRVLNLLPSSLAYNSIRGTFDGASWFVHAPSSGTIAARKNGSLTVQPSIAGLAPGIYDGVITLMFRDFDPRTVRVLLALAPPTGPIAGADRAASPAVCSPFELRALFTNLPEGFAAAPGSPVPVEARLIDDCGVAFTNGGVILTMSNGDRPVKLTSLKDGRWTGTWTPQAASGPVVVSLHAVSFDSGLAASAEVAGQVRN